MSKKSFAQRGFSPLLVLIIVAVVVGAFVVKSKILTKTGNNPLPSYSASPAASAKTVDTTNSKNIAPATQSAAPSPEVPVADYLACPRYSGEATTALPPFPATGPVQTTALLFASGTINNSSDRIAGYDWDFEGDGKWNTTVAQEGVQHVYTKAGTFTPKFRIRSAAGKVSAACPYPYSVVIDNGKATSDAITVTRKDMTVNLSKANPNTSLMVQDHAVYSDGNLYGDGFTVSLLKAEEWQLIEVQGTDVKFDMTGKSGAVGESFRVHTVAPASLANGTYKSTARLQYFSDGTWHDAGNINLTVNITD